MKINFSNDLGYGSVKGRLNGDLIKVPSVASKVRPEDVSMSKSFHNKPEARTYMKNYLRHMDMSIKSKSVSDAGRFLVGDSASASREQPTSFDVNDMKGKSESSLAIRLTLSIIAGKALSAYYMSHDYLPKSTIKVNVNMVTALPIAEAKGGKSNRLIDYAKRYTEHDHVVTIRNFKRAININIHFNHALVRFEDQVAVYDIRYASPQLKASIMNDFSSHYPALAKYVTKPQEITQDNDVVSIDIGEGTTDFAVFNDGKLNVAASRSIQAGYGNVLEDAIDELNQEHNIGISSRIELKSLMNHPATFSYVRRQEDAKKAIEDNKSALTNRIIPALSRVIHDAKNKVDIIYIFGGGAIPMAKSLRMPIARETAKGFRGGSIIPAIFIDKQHAQFMNVDGLELILNALTK